MCLACFASSFSCSLSFLIVSIDLNDSTDDFSFWTDVRERNDNDKYVWCEDDESDDDDETIDDAKTEREMSLDRLRSDERRDFSSKRDFAEEIHLSIDDNFWLFWEWKNENRCLIDCDDRLRDSDSRRDSDRDFACHE